MHHAKILTQAFTLISLLAIILPANADPASPNQSSSLTHRGLIRGKITDKATGKPVPNIDVYAPVPGARSVPGDTTNAAGVYSFHILPGAHDLHVTIPYVGGDLVTPRHIDMANDETLTIDFQIDAPIQPAAVQGAVRDPKGKPIPQAEVYAVDRHRGIMTVKTDASGRFTFDSPGLIPNDTILARSGALATSDAYTYSGQKDITLQLTPDTLCSITGQVTDKNGAPVPNAPVDLSIKHGNIRYTQEKTVTDVHGQYCFPQAFSNTTYMLFTAPSGYTTGNSLDIDTATFKTIQIPVIILTSNRGDNLIYLNKPNGQK